VLKRSETVDAHGPQAQDKPAGLLEVDISEPVIEAVAERRE
jgi:hypothetical protein